MINWVRPDYDLDGTYEIRRILMQAHTHDSQLGARMCHEHSGMSYHCHDSDINNGRAYDPQIGPLAAPKVDVARHEQPVTLDPNDPFDAALIPIVQTNRRKRKDYAKDGDPFSNFKTTASMLGIKEFGPAESAFFNVLQKVARLQSLRMNGRMIKTANESVIDTYLDLAVYSVILYAIVIQSQEPSRDEG